MKWLLLLFMLVACGDSPLIIEPPPPLPDSGTPVTFECQPELVDRDFHHCGACDQACPPADSDRCEGGECWCGFEMPCGPGQDCRGSKCITSDPSGPSCEFDEQCGAGYACIEGHCSFVECVPEVCDGIDNDCDGLIDNQGAGPLAEFCVGDMRADTRDFTLPCRSGVRVCDFGAWTECEGDVEPMDEVGIFGCDGVDNDCDGCIDGVEESGYCESRSPTAFDVMFLIDTSGSMGTKIEMVRQAVTLFSSSLSASPQFRWGIVTIPGSAITEPGLYQDLTDFPTFKMSLDALRIFGSTEPQWAAVAFTADGTLPVSWSESSTRIIILFTDEAGQVGSTSPPHTEETMCASLTHGEVLVSVVQSPFGSDFDDCSYQNIMLSRTGGGSGRACATTSECETLETCNEAICVSESVVQLATELSSVISDPCATL